MGTDRLRGDAEASGFTDVNSDQQNAGLQASLSYDRQTAARLGISAQLLDDTLYDAFGQRQRSHHVYFAEPIPVVMEVDPQFGKARQDWMRSTLALQMHPAVPNPLLPRAVAEHPPQQPVEPFCTGHECYNVERGRGSSPPPTRAAMITATPSTILLVDQATPTPTAAATASITTTSSQVTPTPSAVATSSSTPVTAQRICTVRRWRFEHACFRDIVDHTRPLPTYYWTRRCSFTIGCDCEFSGKSDTNRDS